MKVDVVARLTHIWKTGVVVTALLATVVACGSSDSSRARNAALVAGTSCVKPGAVTKISKVSVVCAKTTIGNIWYPTMKSHGRSVSCIKSGVVRKKKSVVWVCGVVKSKKLWLATSPLPPAVLQASVVIEPGVVEPVPVLESTEVATPSQPVVADNNVLANPTIADEPPITTPVTIAPVVTVPVTIATVPSAPAANPPVVTAPVTAATCAKGGTCAIGETGPGGGKVFYLHASGTFTSPGSTCNTAGVGGISTCKYLEAAPSDQVPSAWCGYISTLLNVPATGIGSGMANTTTADSTCTSGAIQVAADYTNNSLSDWFLPSQDELNELCKYARNTGQAAGTSISCAGGTLRTGFASDWYWSSSESHAYSASKQGFTFGSKNGASKPSAGYVRPVRAF